MNIKSLFFLLLLAFVPVSFSADSLTEGLEQVSTKECGDFQFWCHFDKWTHDVWEDAIEIIQDFFLWILEQLFSLAVFLLSLLPDMEFAAIDWSGLGYLMYFADRLKIDIALGILGAGLLFRLTRKLFTLGQW